MPEKKLSLKELFMLHVLQRSMVNMLEKKDPCLTSEVIEEEYIAFVKENLEEFIKKPFFRY